MEIAVENYYATSLLDVIFFMAKDNTVKKEEAEGGSQFADQGKEQETRPKNFNFEKAINFEGIGEGGDENSKFKVQSSKFSPEADPPLAERNKEIKKSRNFGAGKAGNFQKSTGKNSGFIKDLVGTQLPQSYDFRGDADNEEEGKEDGVEGEEGKEGRENREDGEGQVDEYEEERKLNNDKREERKKKEGDAEGEKIKIPEKMKMEVPCEIAWWILGMELWSLLFAPLFFLLILVEWIALKAVSVFKFPKWKKILTWVMFFAACFEIAIFMVLIVAIKETPGVETAIKVMSWASRAKSAVSAGWNSLIGR